MELEFKHIAPYLPYGLKFEMQSDSLEDFGEMIEDLSEGSEQYFKAGSIWELCGYTGVDIPIYGGGEVDGLIFKHESGTWIGDNKSLKPILRPLSDLTDEMIEDICQRYRRSETNAESWASSLRFLRKYGGTRYELPLEFWSYLFELHFDVFGLIDAGLAIDINTLND
jgi:hypothetical protein